MVFPGSEIREPGEDHRGPGDADDTHQFIQAVAVATMLERGEHVLADGIVAAEKEDVGDAQGSDREAALSLADIAQRGGLLGTDIVVAFIAWRFIDHGYALVVVIDFTGEIGRGHDFVVGMCDHQQDVGFEAWIGGTVVGQVGIGLGRILCPGVAGEERGEERGAESNFHDKPLVKILERRL